MPDQKRLIEVAFPLKQASLDSVHEKMCHAGHVKALHIWPARRPLAACRAALIAALLPDPGNEAERKELLEKIGGKLIKTPKMKKLPSGKVEEKSVEETIGGILHWGRESSPDMGWFRDRIRKAYGGRAPKVLDPFAGGGAIPLEAMRLGCEVTAGDINPVAWFILKCTLEYPQKLAGQKRPLPSFALEDRDFLNEFLKATSGVGGNEKKKTIKSQGTFLEGDSRNAISIPEADLAWHVRSWGKWVLDKAKADLERFYPVIDGNPTVAYLWARTVICKNCRAIIPLLKSKWLCKKDTKRVLLTMKPDSKKTDVIFGIETDVPKIGTNPAQRREHDKRIGAGTISRSGAACPHCKAVTMTMEDLRLEGKAGRLGTIMTAVVVWGEKGKSYRLPVDYELKMSKEATIFLADIFSDIPFGIPEEATPKGGNGASRAFSIDGYGLNKWFKLFTPRQLLALGIFMKHIRSLKALLERENYPKEWVEAIMFYMACINNKVADYNSALVDWQPKGAKGGHTFMRWAFPIKWDFVENNILESDSGGWLGITNWISVPLGNSLLKAVKNSLRPSIKMQSATSGSESVDLIVTDPPYYDAIPYSDLMDFFYVLLRRTLFGLIPEFDKKFAEELGPKWNNENKDGELIDDASRFENDQARSKQIYEQGMAKVFDVCNRLLNDAGRFIVVFAHKEPDAWETLVSAIVSAGFVVDGSWPIQTEMGNRTRSMNSAALSSSVWLVCKKRLEASRPGWDNQVLDEMRSNIGQRLRDFWDAGICGPDFVWAATGPALESFSKYPVVKKADDPGKVMPISEFLTHVRRIVVDFVVGRVLNKNGGNELSPSLDDITTYYLLHRYDFGMDDAPIGACILYAISCGLSDRALADQYDILVRTGKQAEEEDDENEIEEADESESEAKSGNRVKLKLWNQRKRNGMGYEIAGGRPIPYIDQVHRLMHLWKAGNVIDVDDYLNAKGLRRNHIFHQLLQSLIELATKEIEERSLLERISKHIGARGVIADSGQQRLVVQ